MLSTQRVNSIFQERVSFSTTSRALNTPPPTGPLIPPPAAPGAVKVKVSSFLSRIAVLTNLTGAIPSEVEEASPRLRSIYTLCHLGWYWCLHLR
jgi:hypothetical protein